MNLNHTLNALCAVGSHPKQRVEKIPILSDTTDEKTVSTPPLFLKVKESRTLSTRKSDSGARLVSWHHPKAPIAQGIEHRPPEAGAQVRILLGALPVS
jgi:hypothetical protein